MRYPMLQDALRWDIPLGLWLADQHVLMVVMSWASLAFEATFVLAMLLPVTRWIFVPAGVGFHLGIYFSMGATFQGYVAAYSVFVPWRAGLERLARRFGRRATRHVVLPDGSVERGFRGFRRLLRELPPLWPLLPLFYLPGAGAVGPRIYGWVARRRRRSLCDGDACAVHRRR